MHMVSKSERQPSTTPPSLVLLSESGSATAAAYTLARSLPTSSQRLHDVVGGFKRLVAKSGNVAFVMSLYDEIPLHLETPSIRLLELRLDGDVTDQRGVRGKLATFELHDDLEYEALSYAWGKQGVLHCIELNDCHFEVSPNLYAALQEVQSRQTACGKSRKLWIDAISINQADNVEKSRQVLLMRDVYAKASNVIIWIGQSEAYSRLAFDTLKRFASDDGTPNGVATVQELVASASSRRAAVESFITNSYFTRMWVVQEIVLAKEATLLCGRFTIEFERLHQAIRRLTGSGFFPFSAATTNITYVGNWRAARNGPGAALHGEDFDLRLFLDVRDRHATNPRDKLYALRGIANPRLVAGIDVDYDKSVETVYSEFSRHVLSVRPDLLVLSAVIARHRALSKLALPSYVPDWTLPKYGGGVLQRYYRFQPNHLFRAAGNSRPKVAWQDDSDAVVIEGQVLDSVAQVIHLNNRLTVVAVSVDEARLRQSAAAVMNIEIYPFTDEPSWLVYFRTLTADRTALSPRISDEYRRDFFATFAEWSVPQSADEYTNLPASLWVEVSKGIASIIEDKEMFVTERGYLGLAHEGVQVGDVVCIFSGGEVPFLLRPNITNGSFELHSECYVHGVMDGEMAERMDWANLQKFSLI